MEYVAGDPVRRVGREEGDRARNVIRLRDTLQHVDAEGEIPTRIGLGEIDMSVSATPSATATPAFRGAEPFLFQYS